MGIKYLNSERSETAEQINVALGGDLGNNVEEVLGSVGKLVDIFQLQVILKMYSDTKTFARIAGKSLGEAMIPLKIAVINSSTALLKLMGQIIEYRAALLTLTGTEGSHREWSCRSCCHSLQFPHRRE